MAADAGKLTALVLLDYSKAFDRLNHQLCLATLQFLGYLLNACRLLGNYLTGRVQSVRLNNKRSHSLVVTCGVP